MGSSLWLWVGFNPFVLGVFHRRAHAISKKEVLVGRLFWIALSLLFNLRVWHFRGGGNR